MKLVTTQVITVSHYNLTWALKDMKLYTTQTDDLSALMFTILSFFTIGFGILVHRAIFKLLNRLPSRPVNILIYPAMVRTENF